MELDKISLYDWTIKMYVRYVTVAAPVLANMVADFAAIITGAAIADLSASCDKVASSIVSSTVPAAWTLFDGAAAGSGKVVSGPDMDGLTTKYARLFLNASNLSVDCYEGWNATTHVGVNGSSTPPVLALVTTASQTFHVFVTPKTFWISNTTTGLGFLEYSREAEYLKGSTYPAVGCANAIWLTGATSTISGQEFFAPRMKAQMLVTGDYTGANARVTAGTVTARYSNTAGAGSSQTAMQDATGAFYHEIRPIWAVHIPNTSQVVYCSIIGIVQELYECTRAIGNPFDTVVSGADSYVILPTGNNGGTLLIKVQ